MNAFVYGSGRIDSNDTPSLSKHLVIEPNSFKLQRTLSGKKLTCIKVKASVPMQITADGIVDSNFLRTFPLDTIFTDYIKLSVIGGLTETIPIEYTFTTKPLVLLTRSVVTEDYHASEIIRAIDFGNVVSNNSVCFKS